MGKKGMAVEKNALRKLLGVRKTSDLDSTVDFRLAFHPPQWVLASVHPAVVIADSFAAADRRAAALAEAGHPALAAETRPAGKDAEAFARCVEGVVIAARSIAHFTGGRTLDMHAEGAAVNAAAAAFALERGYFDGFHAANPPAARAGLPDWKTLTGGKEAL